MKVIIISAALVGAGSLVVGAKSTPPNLTIPIIFEKSDLIDLERDPTQSIFILVPHTECSVSDDSELEKSIRNCINTNKTWLKAI